jgi:hypothetical protein
MSDGNGVSGANRPQWTLTPVFQLVSIDPRQSAWGLFLADEIIDSKT